MGLNMGWHSIILADDTRIRMLNEIHKTITKTEYFDISLAIESGKILDDIRHTIRLQSGNHVRLKEFIEMHLIYEPRIAWVYLRAFENREDLSKQRFVTFKYIKGWYKERLHENKEDFMQKIKNGQYNAQTWFTCPSCRSMAQMGKVIAGNATVHVKIVCGYCGLNYGNQLYKQPSIKLEDVKDFDNLKVIRDDIDQSKKCQYKDCNNSGYEIHHWAPRHLFDDADCWPQAPLCREHHTEWHRKTETGPFWKGKQ